MASPQLAIAKVSFSAVLLRPDPVSCSRIEIDEFLAQLDATLLRCSPANVQKSKQWILNRVVQSTARVAALGKYLAALANTFTVDIATSRQAREPSTKRKRLHVLYVLNDVLYATCVRRREDGLASQLESFLPNIVQSTAAFANCPKHAKKVAELVKLWGEQRYFAPAFITKLQDTIRDAPTSNVTSASNGTGDGATAASARLSKDAPYIMPAMHGDANVPWYDLPAANWLPVIEPNSTRPMNPFMIKPLQFMPGPADKSLIQAVQNLLADVDRIYAKDDRPGENASEDMDMLGQRITLDGITPGGIGGGTYYGWSRKFCEKMKGRKKGTEPEEEDRGRGSTRSRSRSPSRSSSRAAFKRRLRSDSRSISRSISGSRSRRRSYSRDRSRRRSYSRSRSPSQRRGRRYSRSRSRTQDYSPPPPQPPPPMAYDKQGNNGQHQNYAAPVPQPPFPQVHHGAAFPFGVTPPPPPPNWQGAWPPPPPLPSTGGPNWMSSIPLPIPPPASTGWGAHLPPPPPQSVAPFNGPQSHNRGGHSQHSGHDGRADYRGGRGGYRGGRGGW